VSRTWKELKEAIHQLSEQEEVFRLRHTPITLDWGALVLEAESIGHTLEEVAEEGKQNADYMERAREVVLEWGRNVPPNIAFSIFEDLIRPVAKIKLAELGKSKEQVLLEVIAERAAANGRVRVDDVRRHLGLGLARITKKERESSFISRLRNDPDFARELVDDPEARRALSNAYRSHAVAEEGRRDNEERERAPGLVEFDEFTEATVRMDQAAAKIEAAIVLLSKVTPTDRHRNEVTGQVTDIEQKLEFVKSWMEGGRLEDALASILEQGR
jgi:hypothetical protein